MSGVVSAANSLVGSTSGDEVWVVTALSNSNYVVYSELWNNGAVVNAGAVTWETGPAALPVRLRPRTAFAAQQKAAASGYAGLTTELTVSSSSAGPETTSSPCLDIRSQTLFSCRLW